MARIFITGSVDGLGLIAAQELVAGGHRVVLHGRNAARASQAAKLVPGAEAALHGDLSVLDETCALAESVNALGAFDAVIHNAGVGYREPGRGARKGSLPLVLAVNTLATYVLTALISKPKRLVYLSSGLHKQGDATLQDLEWSTRPWNGLQAYSDSKFHDVLIAFAVARCWPDVLSNALEPGWVPTKMGGSGAPDDLAQGAATQVWLAVSEDPEALVSGGYFYHKRRRPPVAAANDAEVQGRLLTECERLSGVRLPDGSSLIA